MALSGTNVKTKTVRLRILSLTISLSLALPAATARESATSNPPPPRYTPVGGVVHVEAAWEGLDSSRAVQETPRQSQAPSASDPCLLSKSAGSATLALGQALSYAVFVTNTTALTETFRLTDTIPNHMSYVAASASGGFNYIAASHRLTASVTLGPSLGDLVPATNGPTYTELSGLQNVANSQNINEDLPDPAAPNNVIAGFWADLDLLGNAPGDPGGGYWYYALLQDSGSQAFYLVVEWKDAQREGDSSTAYTFQIWVQVGTDHIALVYASLQGNASPATVGFANTCGTFGHTQYFNGAGALPGPGSRLSLVSTIITRQLSFAAQLDQSLPGGSLIANTVSLSNASGTIADSALATTIVWGPVSFLPLITR
jgi:uncharacterized repeat protein (TIGR01451 family)